MALLLGMGEPARSTSSMLSPQTEARLRRALAAVDKRTRAVWAAEKEPPRPSSGPRPTKAPPSIPRQTSPSEPADPELRGIVEYLYAGQPHRQYRGKLSREEGERQWKQLFTPPPDQPVVYRDFFDRREKEAALAIRRWDERRREVWKPYGFTDEQSSLWVRGGLDADKPDVASAARRAGITPADLPARVDGRRVAERLNGGERARSVKARLVEQETPK